MVPTMVVDVNGIMIAKTLIDLQKITAALSVLNVTQEQKTICIGATLASYDPVTCVTTWRPPEPAGEVGVVRMASTEELPPDLELLCLHCAEKLSVSEKERACQL